jgi:succinate-semialdehyde dehydrogenase/glutarate-semialdehyde dehydrogenase
MVKDAVDQGAEVVTGGQRSLDHDRGFFYAPTVLSNVQPTMDVARTEVFGPVAPMLTFDDLDEAIASANATPYGLAGYVFTRDLANAFEVSERLEVGLVGVNNLVIATPEAPFGGIKQSGYGREGGSEGIHEYSTVKYVNMRLR